MSNSMNNLQKIKNSLKRRSRSESRFRWYGRVAIILGLAAVLALLSILSARVTVHLRQPILNLTFHYDADLLGVTSLADKSQLMQANWDALPKSALRAKFTEVSGRRDKRQLYKLLSNGTGFDLKEHLAANPLLLGQTETIWLLADDDIDTYYKSWLDGEAYAARMTKKQIQWIDQLHQQGQIRLQLNTNLLTRGDSREPEQAGIYGAVMGSLLTLLLTLMLSFPIGVAAAIYLEEFAPKNKFTDFIEVNINNLPLCHQLFLVS